MSYVSLSDLVQTPSGVVMYRPIGVDKNEKELSKFPLFFKAMQEVDALAKMSSKSGLPLLSIFSQGEYTDGSVDFYPTVVGITANSKPFLSFNWDALSEPEAEDSIEEYKATNDEEEWPKMLSFINRYRDSLAVVTDGKVADTGIPSVRLVDIIVMFLQRTWVPGSYLSWGRSMLDKGLEVYLVPPSRDAEYIINLRIPLSEEAATK